MPPARGNLGTSRRPKRPLGHPIPVTVGDGRFGGDATGTIPYYEIIQPIILAFWPPLRHRLLHVPTDPSLSPGERFRSHPPGIVSGAPNLAGRFQGSPGSCEAAQFSWPLSGSFADAFLLI